MLRLRTEDRVTVAELARRVDALEKEVESLKQLLAAQAKTASEKSGHDLQSMFGIFADDPGYDEVVRRGREWRKRMNRRPEWKGTRREAKASKKDRDGAHGI